ncbi:MAG: BrnT family toxin [Bacteroidota bacterium]
MLNGLADSFDWDAGNQQKCQKHGVSIEEIEYLFEYTNLYTTMDTQHSHYEKRYIAIGKTWSGRDIFVGFTLRKVDSHTAIRPITARYMHQKEVRRYGKENPQL